MFKTQMEAAKNGFYTEQMLKVAKDEVLSKEYILENVAKGKIVIPANKLHKTLVPRGIGKGLKTKVNVNIGISQDANNIENEMKKAILAEKLEADAIMDLSNYGNTEAFRKELIGTSSLMIGTVPIYDVLSYLGKELSEIVAKDFLDIARKHASEGADFLTIHAGITKSVAKTYLNNPRLMNIVSRGGSLLFAWMNIHNQENPFYEYFDELLEICREYDVTISLGDAMRPGGLYDASDASQISELIVLGELTKRAWEKDVQVMIEGPGHVPLNQVQSNVEMAKRLCHEAPFYVLGPIVTDIAPGYDHITGAIGGALAAWHGADFLCYLTPAEHLRLPTLEDVREGLIATKIAAHAGDIAKGVKSSRTWDDKMSYARSQLDWSEMYKLAIDSEKAESYRDQEGLSDEQTCSMCGKMCAVKNVQKVFSGEEIRIYK
jgi:phosphomethylpyrimidine synthase